MISEVGAAIIELNGKFCYQFPSHLGRLRAQNAFYCVLTYDKITVNFKYDQ